MSIDSYPGSVKITPAVDLIPLAPRNALVTTNSTIIASMNLNRKGLWIKSLALPTHRISISFGANPAVAERGITLEPNEIFQMDVFTFTTAQVNAIGTGNLAIQEY